MVVTGILGAYIVVMLPGILAALAQYRGYSTTQVAYLASTEMAGLMIAAFSMFRLLRQLIAGA